MKDFIEKLAEILEVDAGSLLPDTDFRKAAESFDSMMGFSILCMISEEYGIDISVSDFLKCRTIQDLYQKTQKK